jgi:hypothetical protein
MKITEVAPIQGVRVTTDEPAFNEYIRYASDCWYVQMGDSDEAVYECGKIEQLYQEHVKASNDKAAGSRREPLGWRPMDTAPKDRGVVLGYDPGWYNVAVPMVFDPARGYWVFFQLPNEQIRPTHWMPGPEIPAQPGAYPAGR